jgi:hypothetical protein
MEIQKITESYICLNYDLLIVNYFALMAIIINKKTNFAV